MGVREGRTLSSADDERETARNEILLEAAIRKRYAGSPGSSFSLDVRFAVPAGFTILFGRSGAGKTTTLEAIAGLVKPDAGKILLEERLVYDSASRVNVDVSHRGVGYVFQDSALFPHLTVERNIRYGLRGVPEIERKKRVGEILESFRIGALALRLPRVISAGERQRVALARSLVTRPDILLLDEPLAALDAPAKSRIVEDLRAWNRVRRIPILYVTHSREEVFALGERVLVIERGRIVAEGLPQDVLEAPREETVAQLAGFENIFDARIAALHEEAGTMTCLLNPGAIEIEAPLARVETGAAVRVGIRAGDVLLATEPPRGLSARNVIEGTIEAIEERDFRVLARVNCGATFAVLLTPAARRSLGLAAGQRVWLIVKTHSCHLLRPAAQD